MTTSCSMFRLIMLKREVSALLVNPPRPHSAPLSRRGIVLSHVDRESAFRRRRAMRALPEDSPGKSRVAQDIRMMVVELRAVELPVEEIVLYLEKSVKLPDGTTGQALAQCFTDVNSLGQEREMNIMQVVLSMLNELWRWRRRGGGMREYETVAHEAALRDIQGVDIKTGEAVEEESPDAVRSDLLDGIDTLSDQDKLRLGRTIEGLMYGAVQSFLWNAILLFAVALTLLNFLSGDR